MKLKEFNKAPSVTKINKMVESRFGYSLDLEKLTFKKAYRLASALTETINSIRTSYGVTAVEKNPKYMEMLMLRESLDRWMAENRSVFLFESELAKSEAILAAKDIVDSVQDMLEKISKMQSEQMPALLDTIRDQIGADQAEAYKASLTPLLSELMTQLTSARETADTASRTLAGEQVAQPMGMGMDAGMGAGAGADAGMGAAEMPPPPGGDEFNATDAAAGGTQELGRELR